MIEPPTDCRIYLPGDLVYRFDSSYFDQSTKLTALGTYHITINLTNLLISDFDLVTYWLYNHRNDPMRRKHMYRRRKIVYVNRWDRQFLSSLDPEVAERVMTIAMIMGFDRLQQYLRIIFEE